MTSVVRADPLAATAYPHERLPLARSILWYPAVRGARDPTLPRAYPVFVHQSVLEAIREHVVAARDTSLMGFLAGELFVCTDIQAPYVVIDGVFACRHPIENDDPVGVAQRTWDRLLAEVAKRETRLVGWYRSQPVGDVSMSPADVTLHEAHFPEPWQVAVVVRPQPKHSAGAMYRSGAGYPWASTPIAFYELMADARRRRAKRTRLIWTNYHTNDLVFAADERRPEHAGEAPPAPAPAAVEPARLAPRDAVEATEARGPEPEDDRENNELASTMSTTADVVGESMPAPRDERDPEPDDDDELQPVAGEALVPGRRTQPLRLAQEDDDPVRKRADGAVQTGATPRETRRWEPDGNGANGNGVNGGGANGNGANGHARRADDAVGPPQRSARIVRHRPRERATQALAGRTNGKHRHAAAPAVPRPWHRYVRAIAYRRGLVALITIFGTAAGFVAAGFLDPRYMATATLKIESPIRDPGQGTASPDEPIPPSRWAQLATSSAVLGQLVKEQRLYLLPRTAADGGALAGFTAKGRVEPGHYRLVLESPREYRLEVDDGVGVERGTLGDSVGAALGFSWMPAGAVLTSGAPVEFTVIAPYEAEQRLARAMTVRWDATGELVHIQLRGSDPVLTAATVNAIAQRTVGAAADLRRRRLSEQSDILAAQLEHARGALESAEAALGSFQRLRAAPPGLTAARLERDVATAAARFNDVRRRYEAVRLALVGSAPALQVVDAASRPERPLTDQATLLVGVALMASLGVALLGVLIMDRVDPRLRYPEQVTHGMRLNILGAIPRARRASANGNGGGRAAAVIEALRAIRLHLLSACGDTALTVTVASPGPGDGKSFVAANLALSFAQAGYRVALVDGDIRCGALHRVFDVDPTPGLTDVLAGAGALGTAMRQTRHRGMWLLPSGRRVQQGPELLLSGRLREVLDRLRARFDVIIVDSAPLAAGADPLALGAATGRLLLVLRVGATDIHLTTAKLAALATMPISVVGAVLNDVRSLNGYRDYTYGLSGYELPKDDPKDWESDGSPHRLEARV